MHWEGGNYTATINPVSAGDFPMHVLVNGGPPRLVHFSAVRVRMKSAML